MDITLNSTRIFFWIGSLFYSLAFLLSLGCLLTNRSYLRSVFYVMIGIGLLAQSIAIYMRGILIGAFPVSNVLEILQVISWLAIFLIVIIQINFRLRLLGFFGSAMASVLGIFSLIFRGFDHHVVAIRLIKNPWIEYHGVLAIFAYGLFGLLGITSLMYLLQDYGLSHKRFGGFFGMLPSLRQLDEVSRKVLLMGVLVLSISVAIGTLIWIGGSSSVGASKMISAWGLWIAYVFTLYLREKRKSSPRYCAWICLSLFVVALLILWPIEMGHGL